MQQCMYLTGKLQLLAPNPSEIPTTAQQRCHKKLPQKTVTEQAGLGTCRKHLSLPYPELLEIQRLTLCFRLRKNQLKSWHLVAIRKLKLFGLLDTVLVIFQHNQLGLTLKLPLFQGKSCVLLPIQRYRATFVGMLQNRAVTLQRSGMLPSTENDTCFIYLLPEIATLGFATWKTVQNPHSITNGMWRSCIFKNKTHRNNLHGWNP